MDSPKTYKWKCPYCLGDALGCELYLKYPPYHQRCAFCGCRYCRGLRDGKLWVYLDDVEDLVKYLISVYLIKWEHISNTPGLAILHLESKKGYVEENIRLELENRYGWIGTIYGFTNLGKLFNKEG